MHYICNVLVEKQKSASAAVDSICVSCADTQSMRNLLLHYAAFSYQESMDSYRYYDDV